MIAKNSQMPLYEQALKQIEGQIVSGVYQKGDLLPSEKELIEQLGVSRITVRKALAMLAEMGLIQTVKGRGSEVLFSHEDIEKHKNFAASASQYMEDFRSSTQIRMMLEPEIARLAASMATPEQTERLRNCLQGKEGEEVGEDFHKVLAEIVNNPHLDQILGHLTQLEEPSALNGTIPPDKQAKISRQLASQHERIVQAIEEKDGEFAYFYMKEHIRFISRMYEEYFARL